MITGGSFRERMAGLTNRILVRVGDCADLEDGSEVKGTFENPSLDPQAQGSSGSSKRLASGIDAAELDEPRFNVTHEVAARLPRGAKLTIKLPPSDGGGRYRVVRQAAAGDGMVALVLELDHERTADIL